MIQSVTIHTLADSHELKIHDNQYKCDYFCQYINLKLKLDAFMGKINFNLVTHMYLTAGLIYI